MFLGRGTAFCKTLTLATSGAATSSSYPIDTFMSYSRVAEGNVQAPLRGKQLPRNRGTVFHLEYGLCWPPCFQCKYNRGWDSSKVKDVMVCSNDEGLIGKHACSGSLLLDYCSFRFLFVFSNADQS
jgi:hypothetical protein